MRKRAFIREVPLLVLAALLTSGCMHTDTQPDQPAPSVRGKFVGGSCEEAKRVDLPDGAVAAVYLDEDGKFLWDHLESLKGTAENKMCATPSFPTDGPGSCPAGYCMKIIPGTTRKACLPC
jgi:hypothetical protein